jgi:pilus assembly protein FimV
MMRKKLPADRALATQKSMEKPYWRSTALAVASAMLLGFSATDASALALGRITVQSALGEPLRAEIDIPEINAEELASLRTAVASPDAFRSAGLEYNASLSSVRITLERRSDGRHFLRLTSPRPVNEPFLDVILETSWSSGRIVRDYTLLFDPPNLRQGAAPLAAQVSPAAPPAAAAPSRGSPPVASAASPRPRAPSADPQSSPAAVAPRAPAPQSTSGDGKQVTVRAGDTAGKIAAANKPSTISLDQMLVALLRANPDAFIGGNVNRLRSGAVLEVPTADQAALVPSGEASRAVIAQSRDFNEFRRRLAESLPETSVAAADRQASGKVQAQVEDKTPAAASPDKLSLSKGAVQGRAAEDNIARTRAAQEAAVRLAELNKNIADLNRLGTETATAPAAAPAAVSAAKGGLAVPAGAAVNPTATPVTSATSATPAVSATPAPSATPAAATASATPPVSSAAVSATTPLAGASAPAGADSPGLTAVPATASASSNAAATPSVASASAAEGSASSTPAIAAVTPAASSARPAAMPQGPAEGSLLDDLLENPFVPASIGGVLALLLGFGFYRARQRRKSTQVDSSFLESRLQPDSFFGASGGQRIDTNEGGATGSSMVYSPSQLDAAGDVDPVAEADVYLAYGRDLQAEEILKEALRTTPQRVAIHSKLLEIYAKRRDIKGFEQIATEAYGLTRGEGPEWEHICELGHELDASNTLYRSGGQPGAGTAVVAGASAVAAGAFGATIATQALPVTAPEASDLDLDLDFSIGDDEPSQSVAAPPVHAGPEPTLNLNAPQMPEPMPSLDMDFGSAALDPDATPAMPMLDVPGSRSDEAARLDAPDPTLDDNALSFDLDEAPAPPVAPVAAAGAAATPIPAAPDAGMIEFDLGALSLDLDTPPAAATTSNTTSKSIEIDTDDAPLSTAGSPLVSTGFDDSASGDPLATKLALAQEFNAIGDPDGARSLAEEVIAEASGDLKSQAQRFLAEIG